MRAIPLVDGNKVCRDCSEAFPPTADYFSVTRGRPNSYCKPCARARAKAHYHQNHDRAIRYRAEYRAAHREEARKYHARYRAENAERRRATSRRWRLANGEAARAKARGRYRADPSPYVERARRWAVLNPDKASAHTLRKNHRRRGAELDAEARAYARILRRDPCCYCGARIERPEIDHITPISAGGRGNWDNLTSACKACNQAKSGRTLLDYLLERTAS